jgi:hypothetical protein
MNTQHPAGFAAQDRFGPVVAQSAENGSGHIFRVQTQTPANPAARPGDENPSSVKFSSHDFWPIVPIHLKCRKLFYCMEVTSVVENFCPLCQILSGVGKVLGVLSHLLIGLCVMGRVSLPPCHTLRNEHQCPREKPIDIASTLWHISSLLAFALGQIFLRPAKGGESVHLEGETCANSKRGGWPYSGPLLWER